MDDKNRLIESYLDGDLKGNDLKRFNFLKKNVVDFRERFELINEMDESLKEDDIVKLRESIRDIQSTNKKQYRIRKMTYYISAASILLFISIGLLCRDQFISLSNDELFQAYYQTYSSVNIRGNSSRISDKAFQYYEQGNYFESRENFFLLLSLDSENKGARFYAGIISLELGETELAIDYLKDLVQDSNHLFYDVACWYLTLSYLKIGDLKNTNIWVDNIIKYNQSYTNEAEKLKRALIRLKE